MQRFKAALTCGPHDPNNPEDLVRDECGEYVKYEDAMRIIKRWQDHYKELAHHHNANCTCSHLY